MGWGGARMEGPEGKEKKKKKSNTRTHTRTHARTHAHTHTTHTHTHTRKAITTTRKLKLNLHEKQVKRQKQIYRKKGENVTECIVYMFRAMTLSSVLYTCFGP